MSSPIAIEADAIVDAIVTNLKADTGAGGVSHSTLTAQRVYRDVAPDVSTPYPLVTVSWIDANDLTTWDGTHVHQNILVLTKVTDRGASYVKTLAIAARIATRINMMGETTVNGVYISRIWRDSMPPQPSDFVDGQRYIYHNQVWRAIASPA
jgi:hypothetical protein